MSERPRIVLASASPRRAKLLEEAGIPFEARPADVDERVPHGTPPATAAVDIALRKLRAVHAPGAWVLAADTLLDFEGQVLGKPQDEIEAHTILTMLSGNEHHVITAVALQPPTGEPLTARAVTRVVFRALTDEEIDRYVRTGEPMDKAGAYAVQGRAQAFIREIDGPLDNVIGLPMETVKALLIRSGYSW